MAAITPVASGEMFQEEFLKPMGLTPDRVAKDIAVPATRIYVKCPLKVLSRPRQICCCAVTFGLSDGWWLAVQSPHDTLLARRELGAPLKKISCCPLLTEALPV